MILTALSPQAREQLLAEAWQAAYSRVAIPDGWEGCEYKPIGAALALQKEQSPEVLISGPAGTGKSRAALQKIHRCALRHPGMRALIVRDTRASLSETGLVTFEEKVLGDDHPLTVEGAARTHRVFYEYFNGSRVVTGSLDKPARIMSGEYDLIFVQEAIEVAEMAWNKLLTRLRNGVMPYQQIIGDCNPDIPRHWIKRRADSIRMVHLVSDHKDNPELWDADKRGWTTHGKAYIGKLDRLATLDYWRELDKLKKQKRLFQKGKWTKDGLEEVGKLQIAAGPDFCRLRLGIWAQASGAVYANFDARLNVNKSADYNPNLPAYWGIDDGYAPGDGPGNANYHPRVVLLAQRTALGGINVFAEYVETGVSDYNKTINDVLALGYPEPEIAFVDSSAAMFLGALHERGITATGATHRVDEGIKALRQLISDGNDMRLVMVHPRCEYTIQELQSYRYNKSGKPQKVDDHACDALRYLAWAVTNWNI